MNTDRRTFLKLGLAGLLSSIGCASLPETPRVTPAVQVAPASPLSPPEYQPERFQRAERLFVNTDPSVHYYVEASREEGIRQIRELAATNPLEERFYHVQFGDRSLWFEAGRGEEKFGVLGDSDPLLYEFQRMPAQRIEITSAHPHISPRFLEKTDPAGLKEDYFQFPSVADIIAYAAEKEGSALKSEEWGKELIVQPSLIITERGYFFLEVTPTFQEFVAQCIYDQDRRRGLEIFLNDKIAERVFNAKPYPSDVMELQERLREYMPLGIGITYEQFPTIH